MFAVTILGNNSAVPAFDRHPTSQVVTLDGTNYLVDCGEGTQIQLINYKIRRSKISHIFISHLHGDHYLGLMGLIFTLHLNKRKNDLHVYSHKGLDEIITLQLQYSKSALNYKIVFHQLTPGKKEIIFEDKFVTVETIPLLHKLDCSGFLIREKRKLRRIDKELLPDNLSILQLNKLKAGEDILDDEGNMLYKNEALTLSPRKSRSYAYCSDTQYYETIIEQVKAVDVLYHEATFMEADVDKAAETKHSTVKQAATIALKAGPVRLLIGHFSARYKDLLPVIDEAKRVFPNTYLALEGETFTIED